MKPNTGARRDVEAQGAENSAPSIWGGLKQRGRAAIDDMRQIHTEMFNGAVTPLERLQRSIKHGLLLLGQLCLIMGVYAAGCAIASVLPISLPGNILGMVLLLVLLGTHVLKTKYISEACDYLIENMSIFFIPAGVAIMGCFSLLESSAAKFAFVCIATTVIVFLATSYTVLFVSWVMAKMGCDMPEAASVAGAGAASATAPANTNALAHEDASAPASCTTPSAPNAAPASTEKEA
jgi:holin-like protein